jgi:hypothetical protein
VLVVVLRPVVHAREREHGLPPAAGLVGAADVRLGKETPGQPGSGLHQAKSRFSDVHNSLANCYMNIQVVLSEEKEGT